jgi:hypothetical protein
MTDLWYPTEAQLAMMNAEKTVYVHRVVPQGLFSPGTLHIFGKVNSLHETLELERKYYPRWDAFDQAEFNASAERMLQQRERGYLFGWWHSVDEVVGEPGSAHVTDLVQIPFHLFEKFRLANWNTGTFYA